MKKSGIARWTSAAARVADFISRESLHPGVVDWAAQLAALKHDGFRHAVSLETHWRGAGTPEASSRISMQGLKDALAKAGTGC